MIDLWERMQRYPGCLPDEGGLRDQEEKLMRDLDTVSDRIAERDKAKRARTEAKGKGKSK